MPNPRLKKPTGSPDIKVASGTVARTDTAQKTVFTLPAGSTPRQFTISAGAGANSNAGTTAVVNVGKSGNATFFGSQDVRAATTPAGSRVIASPNLDVPLAAATPITAQYAETGTAGGAGGPWTVTCYYT